MNKTIILLIACFIPAWLQAQTTYHIKGTIPKTHPATKAVMSYPPDEIGGEYLADTAVVSAGRFEFRGTIARPQLGELNLILPTPPMKDRSSQSGEEGNNMKNVALFYLDGAIAVDFDDAGKSTCTGGGLEQQAWRDYEAMASAKSKAEPEKLSGMLFYEELIADFVKAYPDRYVSVDMMDLFTHSSIQPNLVEPMYQSLSKRMQNSEKVLSWVGRLEKAKLAVSGTQLAPSFTLNDVDGNPVSLESYRGGYVLVDFWASWCVPCREENPNVLAAYEKYKDKNFAILTISLDTKKDLWLKAIQEDKLPWTQLCDFKANKSEVGQLYDITSIPANVLVDPQGYIVGKDLRGKALHDKLAEIYAN